MSNDIKPDYAEMKKRLELQEQALRVEKLRRDLAKEDRLEREAQEREREVQASWARFAASAERIDSHYMKLMVLTGPPSFLFLIAIFFIPEHNQYWLIQQTSVHLGLSIGFGYLTLGTWVAYWLAKKAAQAGYGVYLALGGVVAWFLVVWALWSEWSAGDKWVLFGVGLALWFGIGCLVKWYYDGATWLFRNLLGKDNNR